VFNRYYARSKISQARFRRLLRLFALDLTAADAARLTDLSVRSVNDIYLRIRERLAYACEEEGRVTSGQVEVDESYFGPKRVRGKRGRGAGGKTIVFGIFKRNGKVYTEIVEDCSKRSLLRVIRGQVAPRTVIHSDGWRGYDGLVDVGYKKLPRPPRHRRVRAGQESHQRDRELLGLRQTSAGEVQRRAEPDVLLSPEGDRVPLQPPAR